MGIPLKKQHVKLTIPSDLAYLPIVLNVTREMAKIMGFAEGDIYKLEVGAEEAVTNVIKYAFDEAEDANFDVILEGEPIGLNIIIKEKGVPFDPTLIHQYSKDTLAEDLNQKGLGTYLMKQFVDDVLIRNLGREGMETHLFKHLNNKQIHELISAEELAVMEQEKTAKSLPEGSVDYTIRRMQPSQAVDVSKGAYSSYGYTYAHEDIYYPDRVRELNKTDKLISFVAITRQQEIIAHNAIENEVGMPPELGAAFTKPKYRHQGCLNHLIAAILDEARQRNYSGMYARGVTTHPFSQKTLLKYGFKESALFISSGIERKYKGIEQKKIQRESVFIMYRYFLSPGPRQLYPPAHHRQMITGIYQNLGVCPVLANAEPATAALPAIETAVNLKTDPASMTAHIFIVRYGQNALLLVKANLKALCLQRLETVYLHLPLSDRYTSVFTEQFETLGFFFSGIMPGDQGNDELILQYLNNYMIDYELLRCASDVGIQLLDYVRKADPNQFDGGIGKT